MPEDNAIAGDYHGFDAVLAYFRQRRAPATNTFRLHPGEALVGDDAHAAVLTDGTATIDGVEHRRSTLELYRIEGDRIEGDRIAGCWPLEHRISVVRPRPLSFRHARRDRRGGRPC